MLLKNWPSEGLDELMDQYKERGSDLEKWAKAEKYFITLLKHKKIEERLKLWKYKQETEPKLKSIINELDTVIAAFSEIRESKYLRKILGAVVKMGNFMNAGDAKKERADGFDLDSIAKCNMIKAETGKNIYKIILEDVLKEDEEFPEKWLPSFGHISNAIKAPINDVESSINKALKEIAVHEKLFESVIKFEPDLEKMPFYTKTKQFFEEMPTLTEELERKLKQVKDEFADIVNYFMIGKNDDHRHKSEAFFVYFKAIVDDVQKNMPKVETKKPMSKAKSAAPAGGATNDRKAQQ